MTPAISVIVPARNERTRLPVCIEALRAQTLDRDAFEIIVVDDGSHDGTGEWAQTQKDLVVPRIDAADPYLARNDGARRALAPLLAFTDAHCAADRRWLENVLHAFDDANSDLVTGPLAYPTDASRCVRLYGAYHASKMALIDARGIEEARFCHAGNLALRQSLFEACGGFAPLPLPGDTELLQRVRRSHPQAVVRYLEGAVVRRQSTRTLGDLLRNTVRHARLNRKLAAAGQFRTLSWPDRRAAFSACRRDRRLSATACVGLVGTLLLTMLAYNGARWRQRSGA